MNIYLDKLELHGFKSFPEKSVIRFHRGITAVVGPNGCGKSNIVDAILWVLGEQRIKNLRGENSDDLIFNGSASKKPLGMTEVGATFQTETEPVYIARRFFRSGEGKYIHNERFCRHKDIQDELFKMNLGGTGYYIFEQGSIEKLLALKPTEQRVLIEEAAGIAKYLERKKETVGKLIISMQNLENIDVLLADKGERLKELRNQVNYVQRYRKAKEEWTRAQKTLLNRKHRLFSDEFSRRQQQVEALLNEEALLGKEVLAYECQVLEGEEKRWRLDQQLKENQKKSYESNRQITALKGEHEQFVQRQEFLQQRAAELLAANHQGTLEMSEYREQLLAGEAQHSEGSQLEKKLGLELDQVMATHKTLSTQRAEFLSKEKELHKGLFDSQSALARAGNQFRELEKSLLRAENDIMSRQKVIQTLQEQTQQRNLLDLAEHVAQLNVELQDASARHEAKNKIMAEIGQRQQEADGLCRTLTGTMQTLAHHKNKVQELKGKLIDITGAEGDCVNDGCLQELIEAAAADRPLLESFYYDLMDALVVDGHQNNDLARLKKAKLKYPCPGIDWPRLGQLDGVLASVHDLFSLRGTLSKDIFPNGLVVRDLAIGLRIFLEYGVAVVTRQGETISMQGLLFRKREKGVLDVLAEIRRLDDEHKDTETRLQAARLQKSAIEEELKAAVLSLNHALEEKKAIEKDAMRMRSDWESMQKQADQNRRRIEQTQAEIDLAKDNKAELEEERLLAQKRLAEAETALARCQAQKEAFQGENQTSQQTLSEQEKLVMQRRHECQLQRERVEAVLIQNRRLGQQKTKLSAQMEQNERDVARYKNEAEALEVVKAKNREQDLLHKKDRTELDKGIATAETVLDRINSDLKKANEALGQGRKQLEERKERRNQEEMALSALKKDLFTLQELAFKELNLELRDVHADGEFLEMPLERLDREVLDMDDRLRKMRDSDRLNFSAESEYEILMKDHGFLEAQKQDVLTSIQDMHQAIAKIDNESQGKFRAAFKEISANFIANFKILFEGGEAELSLMDTENVLETGLEIKAQPPGKRLQGLRLLSGGEKTLTSLAFLFALFQYKPSPFCVFDEVDASLDEANIQRFLKFLHTLKVNTQFLIITHNFKTMEEADYIYGISMNEPGISSVYSMKMTGKEKLERLDS